MNLLRKKEVMSLWRYCVSKVHDLSPFSYQDYSSSDFLCPFCTVSYLVHSMHRWSTEIMTKGGKRKMNEQRDKDPPRRGRGRSTAAGSSAAPRGLGDRGDASNTLKMRRGWR